MMCCVIISDGHRLQFEAGVLAFTVCFSHDCIKIAEIQRGYAVTKRMCIIDCSKALVLCLTSD